MENNQGWVKVHRKILEKGWWKNSKYVHLWIHLILKANHETKEFLWNGEIIKIEAGQFITGRKELSKETGIRESTIEDILKVFENQQQIRQQKTSKFRLIIIEKWKEYQQNGQQKQQQSNNRATTEQQQTDTNKNEKNEKNEKKREVAFTPPLLEELKKYCEERKNKIDPENFINFYQSKGWMIGKNKMKDWKAAVRTWEGKNKEVIKKIKYLN